MTHVKNVEAFGKLVDFCTGYGEKFKPSSPNLQIPSLISQLDAANQAMEHVAVSRTIFDKESNRRRQQFGPLGLLASSVLFMLQSSGAKPEMIADARYFVRKLKGYSRNDRASAPTEVRKRRRSTLQLAYASKIDWFGKMVEVIEREPLYNPNEPGLTTASLTSKAQQVSELNDMVHKARVNYSNALIERNNILYGANSLYSSMTAVKKYIRAIFGLRSAEYEQVKGLCFTKPE